MNAKPTVVLLPGLDGTGRLFRWLSAALEHDARLQVVSYPPDRFLDYHQLAELVLEQTPTDNYAIVTESFSGPVAVKVGATKPAALRGIILSTSFVLPPVATWFRAAPLGPLFRVGLPKRVMQYMLLGSQPSREVGDEVAQVVSSVSPSVLGARVREALRAKAVDDLRSCAVPVVYLEGGTDCLVGSRGFRDAQRARPSMEVVTIDGPHMLLQARPIETAAVIRRYLQQWFAS